jgi:surface polysaccharide O-acyltransferase-like enzyme
MQNTSSRVYYLDFLRCIACIAVVTIHVTADYIVSASPANSAVLTSLIMNALSRWAVPVFIMVSGAVLLNRYTSLAPVDLKGFYQKRIPRMLVLISAWSGIYIAWVHFFRHEAVTAKGILQNVLMGNTFMHLYFLFLILGLYAVTPFLGALLKMMKPRQVYVTITATLAATALWNFTFFFTNHNQPPSLNLMGQWIPYVGYYVAGYALLNILRDRKITPAIAAAALLPSLFMVAALFVSRAYWGGTMYFYEYVTPLSILQAFGIFILGKMLYDKLAGLSGNLLNERIGSFASLTLGIYLVHIIILDLVRRFVLDGELGSSGYLVVGTIGLTILISALLVKGLQFSKSARRYLIPE